MGFGACRLCCSNRGCSYLFDKLAPLSGKLKYFCVNIDISQSDGLPTHICSDCERDVNMCYEFVKKCEEADKKYRFCFHDYKIDAEQPTLNSETCHVYVKTEQDVMDEEYKYSSDCDAASVNYEFNHNKKLHKTRKKRIKYIQFQCDVCSRCYKYKSMLINHLKSHSDVKSFVCDLCNKTFKRKNSLDRHCAKRHNTALRTRDFVCEVCAVAFFTKNDIIMHLRTHTGETPYSCQLCSKKFTQIGSLRRHEKGQHFQRGHKPFSCEICSKQFHSKGELVTHRNVHTSEKNHQCPICEKKFKFKNNVTKHMKLHNPEKIHVCELCSRVFTTKHSLKKHIVRLHSAKSGLCEVCLKDVPDLESHLSKHRGERPFKCDYCPSTFSEKNALTYHTSFRHINQDKYKCTFEGCIESFPSHPMLEYHTAKVHGTVMPYLCDSCCRGFYRRSDLARHMIGTHKERL